jgi:hypothetical protein
MTRKWTKMRRDAYLDTDHGRAFTKCGGVASGQGVQMATCIRKVKDMTRRLRDEGFSRANTDRFVEDRVMEEFVIKRRDLMLKRATRLKDKADRMIKLATTVRVRRSKPRSASRSPSRSASPSPRRSRRLRFGFSL